ncbi:MAG: EscU/YscU/HrcU family type III secretion system export apparatus switch protein [Defluviitaleaceae bacterium]|nr:EscU/YscU/HrcU family type III secretion system export apparatus switch protein [Defluviitaleaceae bacterium]
MEDKEKNVELSQKAVAIKYNPGEEAPKVVAKGSGHLAQKIIDTAQESDVQLYKNPELVDELNKIDLGAQIPPELYEIVAQILVFIDDLDKLEEMRKNAQ